VDDAAREQEREVLTEAIQLLKKVRRQELGQVTTRHEVIELLQPDHVAGARFGVNQAVCERLSVVIDALAFHAGEDCTNTETIHGIISMLSEMRKALLSD
jgi:hypothetical protein